MWIHRIDETIKRPIRREEEKWVGYLKQKSSKMDNNISSTLCLSLHSAVQCRFFLSNTYANQPSGLFWEIDHQFPLLSQIISGVANDLHFCTFSVLLLEGINNLSTLAKNCFPDGGVVF